MGKYLKLFDTHAKYLAFTKTSDFIKPNVSHCVQENEVHYNPYVHDYAEDYLTFVAKEDGAFYVCRSIHSFCFQFVILVKQIGVSACPRE